MTDRIVSKKITITGAVQGVGFRPFVYRLAQQLGINGWVRNDASGVVIAASADAAVLESFIAKLSTSYPPLASIGSIVVAVGDDNPVEGFSVVQSSHGEVVAVDVSRDTAVCEACLREMLDPANRRFRHAFINCTDCGPRFTIIKSLPYDRPATTMAAFPLCRLCAREYQSPSDRRFHAQPICCRDCGPKLSLVNSSGALIGAADPIVECISLLKNGAIVAIKGIGGYHAACRADSAETVAKLRRRKHREEKPLAIMAPSVEAAFAFAETGTLERQLLESIERPIVLCLKKKSNVIAPNVAPGLPTLGIMLPYTPIHHLLFFNGCDFPLVMTSGNLTDEPIVYLDKDAHSRLGTIADAFLTHNRGIHIRNDDSIVRAASGVAVMMRRSRGYVPDPLPSRFNVDSLAALGGVLKSTIAVGRKNQCYLSQYVGAVTTVEGVEELSSLIGHLQNILGVSVTGYAADLHPDAIFRDVIADVHAPVERVQHHHAHAAACMAENELHEKTLCIVFDGTGYGLDGSIWGGELLYADFIDFVRLGHSSYLSLPGADEAIKNPGRIALAALYEKIGDEALQAMPWMSIEEKTAVIDMVRSKINCPAASSMGRLFDALSAMLGVCTKRTYEGQPAIELEGCAQVTETGEYDPAVKQTTDGIIIDGPEILLQAYLDFSTGTARETVAARFHTTVARAAALFASMAAEATGCRNVCLSGGCFQNALLLDKTVALLKGFGLAAFIHRRLPPNDECIAYGQMNIAGARREQNTKTTNSRRCLEKKVVF